MILDSEWVKITLYVLSALSTTIIPLGISLISAIKARKEAKTAEQKEAANNAIKNKAIEFIQAAETEYKELDKILKQSGKSAGCVKKELVITKLQNFATENNFLFDSEFWSTQIDNIVEFTRAVNSKQ